MTIYIPTWLAAYVAGIITTLIALLIMGLLSKASSAKVADGKRKSA